MLKLQIEFLLLLYSSRWPAFLSYWNFMKMYYKNIPNVKVKTASNNKNMKYKRYIFCPEHFKYFHIDWMNIKMKVTLQEAPYAPWNIVKSYRIIYCLYSTWSNNNIILNLCLSFFKLLFRPFQKSNKMKKLYR